MGNGLELCSETLRRTPDDTEYAIRMINENRSRPGEIKEVNQRPNDHRISPSSFIIENMPVDDINHDPSLIKRLRSTVKEQQLLGRNQVFTRTGTIFRIPNNIRRCNREAYAPLAVPIGPYHQRHQLPVGTIEAIENHKFMCLRRLLFRHGSRRSATKLLDRCFLAIKAMDARVRSCYADQFHEDMDVFDLAMIMLLDGCFILHLLLKKHLDEIAAAAVAVAAAAEEEEEEEEDEDGEILLELGEEGEMKGPLLGKIWLRHLVLYDLLKLENQIPFFVLTTLFNLLKTPADEGVDLVDLAFQLFTDMHPSRSQTKNALPSANEVLHLLHLFHSTLIPSQRRQNANIVEAIKAPEWVPTATELQQAGVKFVKKKNASSFLDISFSSNGTMEIPELCLYDRTDIVFRNLIAFEQCYPDTRTYITIYAIFMDCLIDSADDVRLLHLKGIICNRLSTDEAAAELFNKLTNQIHYALDRNYLHELFINVNKYHESRWNKWRAGLVRDYFSNPWTIISVTAAVVLLLLTIEQSFFTAYSYFKPPS